MSEFSLRDAKEHFLHIKEGKASTQFNSTENGLSLREFAKVKDKNGFKTIVKFMLKGIKTQKSAKLFRKEPLALIESICLVVDHSTKINYYNYQAYRGIKMKRPSVGATQKFFQKIYGSHFFVK